MLGGLCNLSLRTLNTVVPSETERNCYIALLEMSPLFIYFLTSQILYKSIFFCRLLARKQYFLLNKGKIETILGGSCSNSKEVWNKQFVNSTVPSTTYIPARSQDTPLQLELTPGLHYSVFVYKNRSTKINK